MKILNVNMSVDPVKGGGTAERTFQISKFLAKNGIECTVLTSNFGLTTERIKDIGKVNVIALPCLVRRFCVPIFSYKKIKNIVGSVDVVHLMSHWTFSNALVYFIARNLKKPYVVCPAGALPIYGRSRIIKKIYNYIIGKRIIRNAHGHIAIAVNEIKHFQDYGVDSYKIFVIPNGVNYEDFRSNDIADFHEKYDFIGNRFIMFIGRLNYIKGPDLLLRAFCNVKNKLNNYSLLFVGTDEGMLAKLRKMAIESGASDKVHFIGYLGGSDKSNAYHAAELVLIPSRQEAMSLVVLESGITGTPVLLTNQCGFNDVDTIKGGIVVPATIESIQEGLIEILRDTVQLKLYGANLKEYVYKHFTWDLIVSKYLKLYRQILDH